MVAPLRRFLVAAQGALGRKAMVLLVLAMLAIGGIAMREWFVLLGTDPADMVTPAR